MRHATAALSLLILFLPSLAQEEPSKPDTPEQAAERVLAAVKAKDDAALKALAEKDDPDPWLVADTLLSRGEGSAALAFARSTRGADTGRLTEYVQSPSGSLVAGRRRSLQKTRELLADERPAEVLELLAEIRDPPADIVSIRLEFARALALRELRKLVESGKAFQRAASAARKVGWLRRAVTALFQAERSAYEGGDYRTALTCCREEADLEEERGRRIGVGRAIANQGTMLLELGEFEDALSCLTRARTVFEEIGDLEAVSDTLRVTGHLFLLRSEFDRARSCFESALRLLEGRTAPRKTAMLLGNLGTLELAEGNYPEALERTEQVRALMEELGETRHVATVLANLGTIHQSMGNYPRALECGRRSLAIREELRDPAGCATCFADLGNTYHLMGEFLQALEYHRRALHTEEALGRRAAAARAMGNIGLDHFSLGNYPEAIDFQERSLRIDQDLGNRSGIAASLANLALVHQVIGDRERALQLHEQALAIEEELGDQEGIAGSLDSIGGILMAEGDYAGALRSQEESLRIFEKIEYRVGVANALSNLGNTLYQMDDLAGALECHERSLALERELGNREGIATSLASIGILHRHVEDHEQAVEYLVRARDLAEDLGTRRVLARTYEQLARTYLATGSPGRALQAARLGVEQVGELAGGQAEEHSASAREQWKGLFEVGVDAALLAKNPAEVAYFMESGRAGALLESLGGRKTIQGLLVPAPLREEESKARAEEAVAQFHLRRALDAGDRAETARRRGLRDAARQRLADTIARIQREAKAAAGVVYPRCLTLPAIQSSLRPGEALVLYARGLERFSALIATPEEIRVVLLPEISEVRTASARAVWLRDSSGRRPGRPEGEADGDDRLEEVISDLRRMLVAPLELGPECRRLLISPHGVLSYLPFCLLVGERDLGYAPSGTTYVRLREWGGPRGEGVLALGDPDYGPTSKKRSLIFVRGGVATTPLPGSREEARTVGDEVLLGPEANEGALRIALCSRPRWRAAHFACHSLVDPAQPLLSALVLAADEENDGFLKALDVFRMRVPADLVVLSACETGRGKVYRTEGIVGLTSAFMYAGAPRVICSLWKVDDEATKALMVKFYELWNPKEGEGLPAATALKQAQEFVRGHEKWKHPYYWAAWVLWGLPD